MIVFELTMPHVGSWNGKWSGETNRYIRALPEREVPKELWHRNFFYNWPDGWGAMVSVSKMESKKAKKLERESSGFLGYDWMIRALIKDGYIHTATESG